MTYPGRAEAMIVVPSGGAAVSASTGALTNAVAVTVPAGTYYYTAAGGVSSILTTLQTQLENNVQSYPAHADAMRSAAGYGTWSAGWLCNDASGNLTAAFGSPALTPSSSPVYGIAGPKGGIDKAIGFDSASDAFSGGDVFDVTGTDDFVIAWVAKVDSLPAGSRGWFSKGTNPGWYIFRDVNGLLNFSLNETVNVATSTPVPLGEWHVGMCAVERGTNRARIAIKTFGGSTAISSEANIAAIGTMANASSFIVGSGSVTVDTDLEIAALWLGVGASVASGASANLATAVSNLATAIAAVWSVSLSPTTGRVTVANSFWPSYVQFTSPQLRDLLGYDADFDQPDTSAKLSAALGGYGSLSGGAAWLCNDTGSPLVAAYGSPSLTAASSPTYSNVGARGGADKAIGFDSSGDQFGGGDVYDVSATQDLFIAMVVRASGVGATGQIRLAIKLASFVPVLGYTLELHTDGSLRWRVGDGVDDQTVSAASFPSNQWCIVIAYLDRATNTAQVGFCPIGGSPTVSSQGGTSAVGSLETAAAFELGGNLTAPQSWLCSAAYIEVGSGIIGSLSANLATALSNFASYMKGQTGTNSARGVWIPDCPLNLDGDPTQAPRVTDLRQSESPTGIVLGLAGNVKYRHRNLRWEAVPRASTWASAATYSNSSYEQFSSDALFGTGHAWFRPSSRVQVYWDDAGTTRALGSTYNSSAGVSGWFVKGVTSTEPRMKSPPWTGLWVIEWPEVVSDG